MKFNKAKHKILCLGQGNSRCQYRLVAEWIWGSTVEKDLGILAYKRLVKSWQCALAAQKALHILSYLKQSMSSRSSEIILPLSSALVKPQTFSQDLL